jgi:uncharacterized protein YqeY
MTSPLRDELRARLTRARLDRDRAGASALRSAISALENAEAVEPGADLAVASEHVAGAAAGIGAAEAERRKLDDAEERAILARERTELLDAATAYDDAGRPDDAADLRRAADLLLLT